MTSFRTAFALSVLSFVLNPAVGQTSMASYAFAWPGQTQCMDGGADINGDSRPDILVAGNSVAAYSAAGASTAALATPIMTYTVPGLAAGTTFENAIFIGDITGDGVKDVLASDASQPSGTPAVAAGMAWVFNGATGALLFTHIPPAAASQESYGQSVAALGDVSGDGIPDYVITNNPASGTTGAPMGWIFSGATFLVHATLSVASPTTDNFGCSASSAGKFDGDGIDDVIIGATSAGPPTFNGRAYVFSGATGAPIATLAPTLGQVQYGHSVASVDIDTDLQYEVLVGTTNQGVVEVYGYSVGAAVLKYTIVGPPGGFGFVLRGMGDADGDANNDFLLVDAGTATHVYSGKSVGGALIPLYSVPVPTNYQPKAVAPCGLLNGVFANGVPDANADFAVAYKHNLSPTDIVQVYSPITYNVASAAIPGSSGFGNVVGSIQPTLNPPMLTGLLKIGQAGTITGAHIPVGNPQPNAGTVWAGFEQYNLIQPGAVWYLPLSLGPPNYAFATFNGAGAANWSGICSIPHDPSFCGVQIVLQGIVYPGNGGGGYGYFLTNPLRYTLGF